MRISTSVAVLFVLMAPLIWGLDVYCASSNNKQTIVHIESYCSRGSDISDILQALVNEYSTIIIDKGTWFVSKPIYLRSDVVIKGLSPTKSILSINPEAIINSNRNFCLFTTVKPISLYGVKFRSLQEESYLEKTFSNIHISNLTICINRHPDFIKRNGVNPRNADLNVVRYENSKRCSLSNCIIKDYCTSESFNINSVVKLVECDSCLVEKCETENCTFLQVLNGRGNIINSNRGINSIGTWIALSGGRGHIISNNKIENVICNVSTIGVNSKHCQVISNQIINNNGCEISCLTIGHRQERTQLHTEDQNKLCLSADSCYVYGNLFSTTSNVCILIQNGNTILIEKNRLKSCPNSEDFAPGCLYIHGQNDNLFGISIINNSFEVYGYKGSVVCGAYLDRSTIASNTVNTTCRYVFRLTKHTGVSTIENNTVKTKIGEVVSADDIDSLYIRNNRISGGFLNLHCNNLFFVDNTWKNIIAPSILETGDTKCEDAIVVIKNNNFRSERNKNLGRLFKNSQKAPARNKTIMVNNRFNCTSIDSCF